MSVKKIRSALISVYYKDGLDEIVQLLHQQGVTLYSTGGTQQFIAELGIPVIGVEDLTGYPSILGGRVKTLHPKIFGGILSRRDEEADVLQATKYEIPPIDLVIVDLYPFEETVAGGGTEQAIIEKIDIGGISLIRAAAKNFKDVAIIASREHYHILRDILKANGNETSLSERKYLATLAFDITSHYDTAIFNYFNSDNKINSFKQSYRSIRPLRYGENPHQKGVFLGNLDEMLTQLHGKELSYNNLVDTDAAIDLIAEFETTTPAFAILKHTNPCGVAVANTAKEAYLRAFQADTISAFGGVIITNAEIDTPTAEQLNQLFFEVLIAPAYQTAALEILKSKKNRILLVQKQARGTAQQFKSLLNGAIAQDKDIRIETENDFTYCTTRRPSKQEVKDLLFANKIVKHTKSNAIVLAKNGQMLSSGVGQTSRVDALQQAIEKAKKFGFELIGSVMASDAFFPFPDCVEIAHQAGITAVIQPGGSVRDQDSVDYCNANNMAMVMTGIRHFKH